jgi:hypothetical protein
LHGITIEKGRSVPLNEMYWQRCYIGSVRGDKVRRDTKVRNKNDPAEQNHLKSKANDHQRTDLNQKHFTFSNRKASRQPVNGQQLLPCV